MLERASVRRVFDSPVLLAGHTTARQGRTGVTATLPSAFVFSTAPIRSLPAVQPGGRYLIEAAFGCDPGFGRCCAAAASGVTPCDALGCGVTGAGEEPAAPPVLETFAAFASAGRFLKIFQA